MKKNEKIDGRVRELVEEGLRVQLADDALVQAATDAVMERLTPIYGAAATRRRLTSDLRAAFKDGFMIGKVFGKYARWHSEIWNRSETARQLKSAANDHGEAHARYAKYNFDE